MSILDKYNLNDNQLEAASHTSGPALVLAGAGSGKTRILTLRIVNLISSGLANSHEILALTFTNKAAQEIKLRVTNILGKENEFPWMGTFHSISFKILRIFIDELSPKYNKGFTIYDSTDQLKVLKKAIKKLDFDSDQHNPRLIKAIIDNLKNSYSYGEWQIEDSNRRKIIETYQLLLQENNSMDFGDLILNLYEILSKNQKIKNNLQKKFKYILVDEYQDTNKIQSKLLSLLTSDKKNLFAVGDDNQLIYGWRGASVENIIDFEARYPNTKIYKLEENYRSTPQILDVANNLIVNNKKRMDKTLWTQNNNGPLVELVSQYNDSDEAKFVAEKIKDYKDEFKLSDFAVFYRTNAQSRVLEDQLRKNKIPYKIFGNISFYDRAEIKDTVSYLRLVVNPEDEVAFDRIINMPPRGIGAKTLQKLKELKNNENLNHLDLITKALESKFFTKKVESNISRLQDGLKVFKDNLKKNTSMSESVESFLIDIGYQEYLNDDDRIENVSEFINLIAEYEETFNNGDLLDFLNTLSISSQVDSLDGYDESVTLMTVHLAKGLEFPCVFLVGLEDQLFPHIRTHDNGDEIEEERRLCYVAITRAIKRLHLSYSVYRKIFGQTMPSSRSRFIDEISDSKNLLRLDNELNQNDFDNESNKVFHYRFGKGFIVEARDDDLGEDVVLVQFDSGHRKKVFIDDLEEA